MMYGQKQAVFILLGVAEEGGGVLAHHLIETDQTVVQTGSWRVMYNSNSALGGHGFNNIELKAAPCRVKIWRIN